MEHDVARVGDELAGAQLGDHASVQASGFDQGHPAQVRVGIPQSGAADQAVYLGVGERGVGVVDGQRDAFFERHAQCQGVVLGLEGV